jgi:hypothetical protein
MHAYAELLDVHCYIKLLCCAACGYMFSARMGGCIMGYAMHAWAVCLLVAYAWLCLQKHSQGLQY